MGSPVSGGDLFEVVAATPLRIEYKDTFRKLPDDHPDRRGQVTIAANHYRSIKPIPAGAPK